LYINNFLKVCLNLNDTKAIGVLWQVFCSVPHG
jgi:hypothetical protein